MTQSLIQAVEDAQRKSDLPKIQVGDTVDVHVRIIEGQKERTQIYSGVVIRQQGRGLTRTMTVRRIVANEGVERVFPIHSPRLAKIEVTHRGHVRRAKLYYLRERVGKKRRLRDRRRGLRHLLKVAPPEEADQGGADEQKSPDDTSQSGETNPS